MSRSDLVLPPIAPEELTPTVRMLLVIIEQQQLTIRRLEERVEYRVRAEHAHEVLVWSAGRDCGPALRLPDLDHAHSSRHAS